MSTVEAFPISKRGRPRNPSTDEMAKLKGVTKEQAERDQAQGHTVASSRALLEAKLKKAYVDIENREIATAKLREELAILKRENIPASQVREQALRAGAVLKAELLAFSGTLPPLLSGLVEQEMQPVIEDHVHRVLSNFCHAIQRII